MTKLLKRKVISNPFDIDPDTIFFSDLHLHDRKEFSRVDPNTGLNVRLLEGLNILDQIKEVCDKNPKINTVVNLGDVFELKDRVPNQLLTEFKNKLNLFLNENIFFISLKGNHDFNLPNYPTLSIIENDYFHFVRGSEWNREIYFVPFQREWEDFKKEWENVHNQKIKPTIICLHQEIPGTTYETGKLIKGVWDLKTDPDILYLSGHLHKAQKVHGIQFLGSPYPTKFLPQDNENYYIWLYNSQTKQLKPLRLNYSKFISMNYYELDTPKKEEFENIARGNYIKIVGDILPEDYDRKYNKTIKDNFEKFGAKAVIFNIKIKHPSQPEISETLIENDDEIIKNYAEKNKENLDIKKLTQVGLGVYRNIEG